VFEFKVPCYSASKMLKISYANAKLIVRTLKSQVTDTSPKHTDRLRKFDDYPSVWQKTLKKILKQAILNDAIKPKFSVRFFKMNQDRLLIEPLLAKYSDTLPSLRSFPIHTDQAGKARITLPQPRSLVNREESSSYQYFDCIRKERPSTTEHLHEDTKIIIQEKIDNHNLLFNLAPLGG